MHGADPVCAMRREGLGKLLGRQNKKDKKIFDAFQKPVIIVPPSIPHELKPHSNLLRRLHARYGVVVCRGGVRESPSTAEQGPVHPHQTTSERATLESIESHTDFSNPARQQGQRGFLLGRKAHQIKQQKGDQEPNPVIQHSLRATKSPVTGCNR